VPSFIYKGYVLRYRLSGDRWLGTITPPGAQTAPPNSKKIAAAVGRGEDSFCAKAKARIDRDIAAKGKP
jgi:hypothetical protein